MSHTPGPWTKGHTTVRAGRFEFRQVVIGRGHMPGIAVESANASLIAAAPDLLAALVHLVNHVESMRLQWESDGEPRDTKLHGLAVCLNNRSGDLINAAIAKATDADSVPA